MKKTQSYRIDEDIKNELEKIAAQMKIPAGQLVAVLVEEYIEAKQKYGNQVFYPPKFHTFESIKIQEEIDSNSDLSEANGSIKQKAG
ncbi:hypothetical protein P4E94_19685 [Pontiellaceae bacterium B12219]|nr:hypothetical protein [Pontiellaceae bacterium B12219]